MSPNPIIHDPRSGSTVSATVPFGWLTLRTTAHLTKHPIIVLCKLGTNARLTKSWTTSLVCHWQSVILVICTGEIWQFLPFLLPSHPQFLWLSGQMPAWQDRSFYLPISLKLHSFCQSYFPHLLLFPAILRLLQLQERSVEFFLSGIFQNLPV